MSYPNFNHYLPHGRGGGRGQRRYNPYPPRNNNQLTPEHLKAMDFLVDKMAKEKKKEETEELLKTIALVVKESSAAVTPTTTAPLPGASAPAAGAPPPAPVPDPLIGNLQAHLQQ